MLTRRQVLTAMSVAASLAGCGSSSDTGTFSGTAGTQPSLPRDNVDVAIIGAGMAGLSAAQALIPTGRSFVVLEARDRTGGRCTSDNNTFGPQPVDLGAQFFHQSENNPLLVEARRQNIRLLPDSGGRSFWLNGALAPEGTTDQILATAAGVYLALAEAGEEIQLGLAPDASCLQVLQEAGLTDDPFFLLAVAALVNGRCGVPIEDPSSALDLWNFTEFSPLVLAGLQDDVFIPSGMGNFINSTYTKGVPISLSTPVSAINWGSDGVRLETSQGTLRARTVIVTVPTSLLAAGRPAFNPGLPASYQSAFNNIVMGSVDKVILEFRPNTFPVNANEFAIPAVDSQDGVASVVNMFSSGLTVSFVDGDLAKAFERDGARSAVDYMLNQFAGMFGNSIRQQYTGRHLLTTWVTDPWSRGSYTFARPGHVPDREQLMVPISNRIWFAGEAVSLPSHGSLNGAYLAGIRAAQGAVAAISAGA